MQNPLHSKLRSAFTIIEILISVLILTTSIVLVLKIHGSEKKEIVYISERNKRTLSDSLYLSREILKQHKTTKSAYEILEHHIKPKELRSQNILREDERSIYIPEAIIQLPPEEIGGPSSLIQEVKLKAKHSSSYWLFEINL